MTIKGETKVYKHPRAATLYITVPAVMAQDSIFPFREGDKVSLLVEGNCLMVCHKEGETSD